MLGARCECLSVLRFGKLSCSREPGEEDAFFLKSGSGEGVVIEGCGVGFAVAGAGGGVVTGTYLLE